MSQPGVALPPAFERALRIRLAQLDAAGFSARLARRDAALWGPDPARQQRVAQRLGWLDIAEQMRPQTVALRAFAAEVAGEGFSRVILLGMGGSSLAPEVMARTLGSAAGAPQLEVLDNTSPAAVRTALTRCDPRRTFILVSSKSGTTLEVLSFERRAWEWLTAARPDAGRCVAAVTDPGTPLVELAQSRGYRRVFLNPPDIGGRFSALSLFGLVPAALMGIDLDRFLDEAIAEARQAPPGAAAQEHPGVLLGAALGELARGGRDKLTLVLLPPFESLGSWIEQLVAESTGKEGRGIVPIDEEALGEPEDYGDDRAFAAISVGPLSEPTAGRLERLRAAGHPVITWTRPSPLSLGAEFMRWQIATATMGALLEVDPFDEPNVSEAKQATQTLLSIPLPEVGRSRISPRARRGEIAAALPMPIAKTLESHVVDDGDPIAWATALPRLLEPGDYFAILAYFHATPDRTACLGRVRAAVRRATAVATTAGYGPRYLHSTGQLHKGGANRGVFLQLTASEGEEPIPGADYGFSALQSAQADGDYQVLERRQRRVLRVALGSEIDAGLNNLMTAFEAAAAASGTPHRSEQR